MSTKTKSTKQKVNARVEPVFTNHIDASFVIEQNTKHIHLRLNTIVGTIAIVIVMLTAILSWAFVAHNH